MVTAKNKKLVPKLRFPEYKGKWETKRLGEIAKVTSGGTPDRGQPDFWNGDIPWVTTSLIDFNSINGTEEFITKMGLAKSSAKLFPQGTLLMALYGQGVTRGKVALLEIEATTNQACAAILLDESQCHSHFIFFDLQGKYQDIRNLSNDGGQKNLSGGLVKSIQLTLPSPPEQEKIASFLSAVDRKIGQLSRRKELLEQYKKGVMQKIFSQEIRFTDDNGKDYPDWEEKRLEEVTKWASGGTPSKQESSYWGNDIPWISASSMRGYLFSKSKLMITELGLSKGSRLAEKGTILLLVRGSMLYNKVPVGIAGRNVAFNQDVKSITAGPKTFSGFLLQWFLAKQNMLLSMVVGTGIGAGKLDTYDLKKLQINLPTLAEQNKIASFLFRIDRKIESVQSQLEQTQTFKKGLLQQLFV